MTRRHQYPPAVTSRTIEVVTPENAFKQGFVTSVTSVTSKSEEVEKECPEILLGVLESCRSSGDSGDSGDQAVKQGRFAVTRVENGPVTTGARGGDRSRQPAAEPTAPGVDAYLAARRLDALAARPLHELAALFRCLECDAGPGAPCMAADRPHRPRLEIAADARDEWLGLRSPEGLRARRTWNRRIAGLAPSTALYRAAHGLEGIDR